MALSRDGNFHGGINGSLPVDPTRPMNYRYEAIIDFMIMNPDMPRGEIAEALGFTTAYFSTLTNSSAFKARYSFRRGEHVAQLEEGLHERIFAQAKKASERVMEALEDDECDPRFAHDVQTNALRMLGFGAPPSRAGAAVNVQVNNVNRPDMSGPGQGELQNTLNVARRRIVAVSRLENEQSTLEESG